MLKFFRKWYQQLYRLTNNQHGFSLVEVLAAVIILSMISIAFARFSIVDLQAVDFNNQREEAFQLARQKAISVTSGDPSLAPSPTTTKNGVNYYTSEASLNNPTTDTFLQGYSIKVTWLNQSGSGMNQVMLNVFTSSNPSLQGTPTATLTVQNTSIINANNIYINGNVSGSSLLSGNNNLITNNVSSYMNWATPTDPYPSTYQSDVSGVTSQGTTGQTTYLSRLNGSHSYTTDWYLGNVNVTAPISLGNGDFVVNGNLTVPSGESLTVRSGNLLIGGSLTLDNGASVTVSTGTLSVEGNATIVNGNLTVRSGDAYFSGNLSTTSTTMTVSTKNLVVGGSYSQNGGTLTIRSKSLYVDNNKIANAQFLLSNAGTIDISSGNIYSNAPLSIDNSVIKLSTGNIYIN